MVDPGTTSAAALPQALITQILQHVPQQQRLQQCALTCKAWASAAALATAHIELNRTCGQSTEAFERLESWLQHHAGQVESLQLSNIHLQDKQLKLKLPLGQLAKLQRLELQGFKLLLPGEEDSSSSSNGQDTIAPAPLLLPSLQHLQLHSVQLVSNSSLLHLAAGAHGLTSMKTQDISFAQLTFSSRKSWGNDESAMQQLAAVLSSLLQQLPRLAVLELPGMPMSAAAMQQLGGMQGLQHVSLARAQHMAVCELQHLPSSTTQLQFDGDRYGVKVHLDPSLPAQLPQLAGLLQLELFDCAVPPTVLHTFTHLRTLKLQRCTLLPRNPDDGLDTEGTAALLDALSQMTLLQDLNLSIEELDTVSTAPQRFAALTASTHLTRLVLDPDEHTPLAKGAAQYMFSAGKQLPLLQHITISPSVQYSEDWDEWCMDGDEIARIASCCTGLQWLNIGLTVRPGADLSALLKLPCSCTEVLVGGAAFGDASASVLAQLTHVDYLCVHGSPGFTDIGLEQLLTLDLARLYVYDCALSDAIDEEGSLSLLWDSEQGSVQQQLEELCDRSPLCAPARLKRQKEVIKQLRLDNTILRLELSKAKQQQQHKKQQQHEGCAHCQHKA